MNKNSVIIGLLFSSFILLLRSSTQQTALKLLTLKDYKVQIGLLSFPEFYYIELWQL